MEYFVSKTWILTKYSKLFCLKYGAAVPCFEKDVNIGYCELTSKVWGNFGCFIFNLNSFLCTILAGNKDKKNYHSKGRSFIFRMVNLPFFLSCLQCPEIQCSNLKLLKLPHTEKVSPWYPIIRQDQDNGGRKINRAATKK